MMKVVNKLRWSAILTAALLVFAMMLLLGQAVNADPAPEIVTPGTFSDYFNITASEGKNTAVLKDSVTADKLIFQGDFSQSLAGAVDEIRVNRQIVLEGERTNGELPRFQNVEFLICADNVTVSKLSVSNTGKDTAFAVVSRKNVTLTGNTIEVTTATDKDGYAVKAESAEHLTISGNQITYTGKTDGTVINNALYVAGSTDVAVQYNTFEIKLTSVSVKWTERPEGSGNWVSMPISEGLVFDSCHALTFSENEVNVSFFNAIGSYDTIYGISVKGTASGAKEEPDVLLNNNTIKVCGHSYVYALSMNTDNFLINENTIRAESDYRYAAAVDLEFDANYGTISKNQISAASAGEGETNAIGIYAWGIQDKENGSLTIQKNTIGTQACFAYGIEYEGLLGKGTAISIKDNILSGAGDYLAGIAVKGSGEFAITGNEIRVPGQYLHNNTTYDSFFLKWKTSFGIGFLEAQDCHATITDNMIESTGSGIMTLAAADISKNTINVTTAKETAGYAVFAENVQGLSISSNQITYTGKTDGHFVNNAMYVFGSENVEVQNNHFEITLTSYDIKWTEVPEGSGNWVGFPLSEGLVFDSCHALNVSENTVMIGYDGAVGAYDTIYGISVKGGAFEVKEEPDVVMNKNEITLKGHSYTYALQLATNNYLISNNTIQAESDSYYAAAVSLTDGAKSGTIRDNRISAKSAGNEETFAYGIYGDHISNEGNGTLTIQKNAISTQAYLAIGIECSGIAGGLSVKENTISGEGDLLVGIAVQAGGEFAITGNEIHVPGLNQNDYSVWDLFLNQRKTSFGIGVMNTAGCHASITDNTIESSDLGIISLAASDISKNTVFADGEYAVDVFAENKESSSAAVITDNGLLAKEKYGDQAIRATNVDTVQNNKSSRKTQTITASDKKKTYGNAAFSLGAVTDGDGTLSYESGNKKVVTVSNDGMVKIKGAGTAKITISASETIKYEAASKTITVTVKKAANTLKVKGKTAKIKSKNKNQTLKVTRVIQFKKKGQGKKNYKLVSAKKGKKNYKKYFSINKKNGKLTVKKGLKKGTYKVKLKVKAGGNANFKASKFKTVTCTIKVQ